MNTKDVDMKEIMDAYHLSSPSIKIFRRGIMLDYRGAKDSSGIVEYIKKDCTPSVKVLKTFAEVKSVIQNRSQAVVLSFFGAADVTDNVSDMYSMDAWGQFQAAADALRG